MNTHAGQNIQQTLRYTVNVRMNLPRKFQLFVNTLEIFCSIF